MFRTIILPAMLLLTLVSCTNYGDKVKEDNIEVYYKGDISKDLAQKTARIINWIDENSPNPTAQKSFQLLKGDGKFTCKMVVANAKKEEVDKMPPTSFQAIANILCDSVFAGTPVDLDLTDNKFKTIRLIPYKKMDLNTMEAPE